MGKYTRPKRRSKAAVRFRQRLNDSPTKAEAAFARALDELGVPYSMNHCVRTAESFTGYYLVDFYIKSKRLIVELDGAPHVGEAAKWKDALRSEAIKRAMPGVSVVRIWNSDALRDPVSAARGAMLTEHP